MSVNVALDLGTSRTKIYVPSKKFLINEPSVVAIDLFSEDIIAIGEKAYKMLGKTPSNIKVIYPLKGGVVCNFEAVYKMVSTFFTRISKGKIAMPSVVVCVPGEITDVEKRAVVNAISAIGVRRVCLIQEPIAALMGCGVDIEQPKGLMEVSIGAGITEIAVVSLGGIANSHSLKIAGNDYDDEIIKYLKAKHSLLIGKQTAEKIKSEIGCIIPFDEKRTMCVKGRGVLTGMPKAVMLDSNELIEVLREPTNKIINQIKATLETVPPELVGDIYDEGIHLCGGTANLQGLKDVISKNVGLNVIVPEEPELAVIRGESLAIKYIRDFDNKSYGAINPLIDEF